MTTKTIQHTPTLRELLRNRLEWSGKKDRTINIKIAKLTAHMILVQEDRAVNSHEALIEASTKILSEWYKQKHAVPFEFDKLFKDLEKAVKSGV